MLQTRLLNKELQRKLKIPIYTPTSFETSGVAHTSDYNDDHGEMTHLDSDLKPGNTSENMQESGNNMHNKASIYNFRTVSGDNISTISDFDSLYSRRSTIAQRDNYFINSAEMVGDKAEQDDINYNLATS